MSPAFIMNDPAHWLRRAEEARRIADQLDDPAAQKAMLDIARSYEALADLVRTRAIRKE